MSRAADQGTRSALRRGDRRVVGVAVMPVRAAPGHREERVTDWVSGEVVRALELRDGWVRARGPDGYEGWCPAAPLEGVGPDADEWAETATLVSLGTALPGLGRLPWGARARPGGDGGVEIPDGRVLRPADPDRIVPAAELPARRPADGPSLVRSALEWLDVPYVWGGRTELGVDCSGFVQSVFAVHGVALPRDSRDQRAAGGTGLARPVSGREPGLVPGDLLFFAPERRGITHVALSLGGWRIVHAASGNGRVSVDDLSADGPLSRLLAGSIEAATRRV